MYSNTVGVRPAGSGEDVQAACPGGKIEYEGLLITLQLLSKINEVRMGVSDKKNGNSI